MRRRKFNKRRGFKRSFKKGFKKRRGKALSGYRGSRGGIRL